MNLKTSAEAFAPGPEVLADDQRRLLEFQVTLSDMSQMGVMEGSLPLHGDHPVYDAAKHFLHAHHEPGTTLYIHPDSQGLLVGATSASAEPRSARGGQHSAHGVLFLDLLFNNGAIIPVAAKPHEDEPRESAVREYFGDVAVHQLGLEDLAPFGVLMGRNGASYSLTFLEDGLTTLDSVDWRYVMDHVEDNTELLDTWSNVARYAALIHSTGNIRQGDFVPRNIAQRPDNAGVFLIDWERSRISMDKPRDAEVRYNNSFADMGELLEAMAYPPEDEVPPETFKAGIGLLRGTVEQKWLTWEQLVFNEYRAMRREYAQGKDEVHDVEDELVELEQSLKQRLRLVDHYLGNDQ